jgi:hypothetical protein
MMSVPPVMEGWGKLKLGTSTDNALLVSVEPVFCRLPASMTSTGTGDSAIVRPSRRVPVTMTSSVRFCVGSALAGSDGELDGASCGKAKVRLSICTAPVSLLSVRSNSPRLRMMTL